MKSADGKIKCVYPAENAEQVAVVKEDYKRVHGEISDDLDIRLSLIHIFAHKTQTKHLAL